MLLFFFITAYKMSADFVFRNALSSAFSCWETLLGEYEKQAQVRTTVYKKVKFIVIPLFSLGAT